MRAQWTGGRRLTAMRVGLAILIPMVLSFGCQALVPGQQAKKEEVVLGVTLPFTGAFSAFGRYYIDTYKYWEEETNEKGGLLGAKVRLTMLDDKSDAATSVSLYEKMITVDKVDFIVGGFPTPVVMPVLGIAEKFKRVFIQGGANAEPLIAQGNYKYTFTTIPSSKIWDKPLWEWLNSVPTNQRPKKIALVQQVNPFLQDVVAEAGKAVRSMGIEVAFEETYSSDTQDFTAMIQKFKASGVDFVFSANNYPAALSILRTAAEQQFKPRLVYLAIGPTVPEFVRDLGERTDFVFTSTTYWPTFKTAQNDQFVSGIRKKFGYTPTRDNGVAYGVLQVLRQAVEGAKTFDQEKLRQYLVDNEFDTVLGKMKFDAKGMTGSPTSLLQVQGGNQVIVWPAALKDGNPVYPRP